VKIILAIVRELKKRARAHNDTIKNTTLGGAWVPWSIAYNTQNESCDRLDFFSVPKLNLLIYIFYVCHIKVCRHQEPNMVELCKPFMLLEKFMKPRQEVLQHINLNFEEQIRIVEIACDAIGIP
jgi:hypothetical protein